MAARSLAALALCACAITISRAIQAPSARIYLDTSSGAKCCRSSRVGCGDARTKQQQTSTSTPELAALLDATNEDALFLYSEYTSTIGSEMKAFIANITSQIQNSLTTVNSTVMDRAKGACHDDFEKKIKRAEINAHRAALFNGENHHKFFLGHMIVFRMHLNKSQGYLDRCQRIFRSCGNPCETTPRMVSWKKLALHEINRVKDDIRHSRRSYEDLLLHSRRKLKHLRQEARLRVQTAITTLEQCVKNTTP